MSSTECASVEKMTWGDHLSGLVLLVAAICGVFSREARRVEPKRMILRGLGYGLLALVILFVIFGIDVLQFWDIPFSATKKQYGF
jgi:hypothetical protein